MGTSERMRVGQVGAGGFGRRRRASLRESGLFDLVAAYDLSADALAEAQRDGVAPKASYEQLLEAPGLEAIFICTGAKYHAEQVIQAAQRGLHVFVEKPLCATADEMHRLLETWRATDVVIGVGHHDHRSDPQSQLIYDKITNGELGTVAAFEKTTCHAGGQRLKEGDWRNDPQHNPGGMLFQCGVHGIHELMHYFGPIVEVQALFRDDVLESLTTDAAICHLRFADGLIGSVNAYHTSPYRHTLSIFGTKANLYRFDHFFHEGRELYQQNEERTSQWQPRHPLPLPEAPRVDGAVRHFHEAIRFGRPMYPSILDAAQAMSVVFAAEASAREGARVQVPQLTGVPTGRE